MRAVSDFNKPTREKDQSTGKCQSGKRIQQIGIIEKPIPYIEKPLPYIEKRLQFLTGLSGSSSCGCSFAQQFREPRHVHSNAPRLIEVSTPAMFASLGVS
jgi:hypothetical protein